MAKRTTKTKRTTVPERTKAFATPRAWTKAIDLKLVPYDDVDMRGIPSPLTAMQITPTAADLDAYARKLSDDELQSEFRHQLVMGREELANALSREFYRRWPLNIKPDKGVLFMDELSSAKKRTQRKARNILQDRIVDEYLAFKGVPGVGKSAAVTKFVRESEVKLARAALKRLKRPKGRLPKDMAEGLALIEKLLSDHEKGEETPSKPEPVIKEITAEPSELYTNETNDPVICRHAPATGEVLEMAEDIAGSGPECVEWRLFRLANGDLIAGFFPQAEDYEAITQHHDFPSGL